MKRSCQDSVNVAAAAPSLFANGVFHADDTLVSAESPAAPGETLTLYATGLGSAEDETPVTVRMGGSPAIPGTATLVKSVPGLYAIRYRLTATPIGAVPVAVVVANTVSNALTGALPATLNATAEATPAPANNRVPAPGHRSESPRSSSRPRIYRRTCSSRGTLPSQGLFHTTV